MTQPDLSTDPGAPAEFVARGGDTAARQIEAVLEPVAQTMGYEVVLIEWQGASKRHVLRIFLDRDGGVGLDDCARMSRIFGNALEAAEAEDPSMGQLLAGAYNLEVSSPGLERPLARRSHFSRFVGQRAKVRTTAPLQPETRQRSFNGVIQDTEPDPERPEDDRAGTVTLREPDSGELHRIPISAIRRANLVYEG